MHFRTLPRVLRRHRALAMALVLLLTCCPINVTPAGAAQAAIPVVLVPGLISPASSWSDYDGPRGYLASIGRQGFAVGDGQAPGVLLTGDTTKPFMSTNTIAENATILAAYIEGVKKQTGATQVDIVAHSLGGLIARYYIARLMPRRDVNQLIMLGTPNGGSACASLPAQLGIWTPATIELSPSYVDDIFNPQIQNRNGVVFHALAGDEFTQGFQSPCTGAPSDLFVSVDSVGAIGIAGLRELPIQHTSLNHSAEVFHDFVAPLLAADNAPSQDQGDASPTQNGASPAQPDPTQVIGLATGRVSKGGSVQQIVNIDAVSLATFSIFDPTRSLALSVRGANGNVIHLSAAANGFVRVDDPGPLLYLGYGFNNPRPGPWRVTLTSTSRTPSSGADYTIMAQATGGASLNAQTSDLAPAIGQDVRITASLTQDGRPLAVRHAVAQIRTPDGRQEQVALAGTDGSVAGTWRPDTSGIQMINVVVNGETTSQMATERVAQLAVEVQPGEAQTTLERALFTVLTVSIVAVVIGALIWLLFVVRRVFRGRAARR